MIQVICCSSLLSAPRRAGAFSRDITTILAPECRAFSGALKIEKLKAPLIPGPEGAVDTNDWCITFDESRQCRRCAGVLISGQNTNLCHILTQGGSSACPFAQSDQLLFRCLDVHASWNRKYGCKPQAQFYSVIGSCVH